MTLCRDHLALQKTVCFSSAELYAVMIVCCVSMQTGSIALMWVINNLSEDTGSERNADFLQLVKLLIANQANVE